MTHPLLEQSITQINTATTTAVLEDVRVAILGKKGTLTEALKSLGALPVEDKKTAGAELNRVKEQIAAAFETKKAALDAAELNARLVSETLDMTLPHRGYAIGRIHPISRVLEEISIIFERMGFSVAEGPDIEDEDHNFNALNIPESHPARQMHDTFYLEPTSSGKGQSESHHPNLLPKGEGTKLLRTHTSPVQIRTMRAGKPPFRCIAPGSTYRCDSDQTHTPMFHQVEGFIIDKNIHMGHLKGCLTEFLKTFFELDEVPVRFRPSFFPFTEPSAEVDIGCKRGKDELKIGAGDDWLEVLGCGMVHPNVLAACDINPNEWQGFAFGMGVERLAMLKYGIPDLRTFFESDVRWLNYYGFAT